MRTFGDDLILGGDALSKELGVPVETVESWHKIRALPIFKLGKRLAIRRSELEKIGRTDTAA